MSVHSYKIMCEYMDSKICIYVSVSVCIFTQTNKLCRSTSKRGQVLSRDQMQAAALQLPRFGPQEAGGTNGLATAPHIGYRCKSYFEKLFMALILLWRLVWLSLLLLLFVSTTKKYKQLYIDSGYFLINQKIQKGIKLPRRLLQRKGAVREFLC